MPPIASHNGSVDRRHTVAVDVVLFTIHEGVLKVLLVKRQHPPYRGWSALPGGFVEAEESVDAAALRELYEETAISNVYLEQLYTFGDTQRDPRGRVISVAYYALINWQRCQLNPQVSRSDASWFSVKRLPHLAFDHGRIIEYALERLRNKTNYTTVAFQLLPREVTLTQLQRSYEVIVGERLDKRNFRRKMLQLGILKGTRTFQAHGRQRPARLYTFAEPKVVKLQERGIVVPF